MSQGGWRLCRLLNIHRTDWQYGGSGAVCLPACSGDRRQAPDPASRDPAPGALDSRRVFENRLGDERILGSSAFVESVRQTLQADEPASPRQHSVASLITAVCATTGGHPPALREGSRRPPAARDREGVAYLALEVCGYPALAIADLGVRPSAVYRAAQRGKATSARWDRLLAGISSQNIRKPRPLCVERRKLAQSKTGGRDEARQRARYQRRTTVSKLNATCGAVVARLAIPRFVGSTRDSATTSRRGHGTSDLGPRTVSYFRWPIVVRA
jgi:hypothetical protein